MWKENQIQGGKWVQYIGDTQEIVSIDGRHKVVFHFLLFALCIQSRSTQISLTQLGVGRERRVAVFHNPPTTLLLSQKNLRASKLGRFVKSLLNFIWKFTCQFLMLDYIEKWKNCFPWDTSGLVFSLWPTETDLVNLCEVCRVLVAYG